MSMRTVVAFSVFFLGIILNTPSRAAGEFQMVELTPSWLFVPVGFDDNDEVVVVVDGYMPDTCHRFSEATAIWDSSKQQVTVRAQAKRFEGMCFDVLVPFTAVVSLGTVPSGKYQVAAPAGQLTAPLEVRAASKPGPDDYLYAAVDSARVDASAKHIVLEGRFTSTCLQFDRIDIYKHGSTIEVLPILKLGPLQDGFLCMPEQIPFSKTLPLPALEPGRYLLHVRSLNGQAVNTVFNQN